MGPPLPPPREGSPGGAVQLYQPVDVGAPPVSVAVGRSCLRGWLPVRWTAVLRQSALDGILSWPATPPSLRRPEIDGVGGAADLQTLPQRLRSRIEPAADRLGRLALSHGQDSRFSGENALDVAEVLLQELSTLAACDACARLGGQNDAERGHVYTSHMQAATLP